MKLPLNRVVAFVYPYVSIAAGALADWLLVHVHLLGLFHTNRTAIASVITQIVVFGLTAILTWLGAQKWLSGWQGFEQAAAAAKVIDEGPTDG